MRITTLVLVALTLSSGGPAMAGQKETETVDRTIAFSRGGTLRLRNFSGDVRITGTPGNDVLVHAVRTATRDRLDAIKLDIEVDGSTITVEANRKAAGMDRKNDNVVETRFDIQVPAAIALDVHAFSSDLTIRGTTGDITAQTFSGRIDLDVSSAGAVPDLKVETFSGDITARVPENTSGRLAFSSFSGDLRSDLPLLLNDRSRRNIRADLGSGSGSKLDFTTFSGDLRLVK
jgi:DUF4097 and DUF4098 domain-containing protein YvlB